ncbi:DUF6207 family protein [Streptomyces mirabilis]|uniref:DUF6207 family protein n=1 Tax=Streptomyces mirabilis TaxID=68239 RepID=UPI0036930398
MGPISEVHVAEPGIAVVEVAAADDQTAFALQEVLAARWATATADRTTRVPGGRTTALLPGCGQVMAILENKTATGALRLTSLLLERCGEGGEPESMRGPRRPSGRRGPVIVDLSLWSID